MKVWVIRYFSTEGIFLSEEGEIDKFGYFKTELGRLDCRDIKRNQYRLTLEDALQYVEHKRTRRLQSLRNQIKKLEAMTWGV